MKIRKFVNNHPTLLQAAAIRDICRPLELLNIHYFSHARIDKKNELAVLATTPDFFQLYFNKGYHQYDLHMSDPGVSEEYILWDLLTLKNQSYALEEDFMSFNVGHTFSLVINNANEKNCYHFATRLGNTSMNGTYLKIIEQLKQFINYFNEKISQHKELNIAYSQKLKLEDDNGGYLIETDTADFSTFLNAIQSSRVYSKATNNYLTKRELDCLFWLGRGKTIVETALILNISARTVKAHVNSAKEKLNCINQFQLGFNYSKLLVSE